jgi:voltage-gated potassium channel Kch
VTLADRCSPRYAANVPVDPRITSRSRVLRRGWRGARWRVAVVVLVFACGYVAFTFGVGATERPNIPNKDVLARIYYTLGLFVLGGMDLGTPLGGPPLARVALWFTYFAAPAVTATALIEGVMRMVQPQAWMLRRLRGHVVIGGSGKVSMLFLRRFRQCQPRTPVVIIEPREDHAHLDEATDVHRAKIVHGDVADGAILERLQLHRAQRVVLLTGDDFSNLEAAAKIQTLAPDLAARTIAHVSDLRFMRAIDEVSVRANIETFNTHQIAASHLVKTYLLDHFAHTAPRDVVVLAGFGRFGQTVLDQLQKLARGQFHKVIIIDTVATQNAELFAAQIGFDDGYEIEIRDNDVRDAKLWQELHVDYGGSAVEPVIIVGSGDAGVNVRTALTLSSSFPEASVIARSFHRSVFAEELGRSSNLRVFAVADLVEQSMPERWFDRRSKSS